MTPPIDPSSPPVEIARAGNQFAFDLWAHASGTGTIALSPASVATALAITWGGAKGETSAQLQKVLRLEGAPDVVLSRAGILYKSLAQATDGATLKLANRLYGEKTYPFDTTYFTIVRHAFGVWIEPVDFAGDPQGTRAKINTWVAEQTEQRIEDLIPPTGIDAETRLVIVNAIYFLADWATPFNPSLTQPRDFFVDGTTKRQVPTMTQSRSFRYAKADGAALVELPYKGDRTSMYVILPDANDGLPALEAKLADTLKALQSKLTEQQVKVSLPRFTIDPPAPIDLAEQLKAMGVVDAFDAGKADFSNIARPKNASDKIFIGAVFHKAFVKVDEKGTEAAAATAIAMPRGGPPAKPTEFRADHPFLFAIVDRPSGLILFLGRVTDPA